MKGERWMWGVVVAAFAVVCALLAMSSPVAGGVDLGVGPVHDVDAQSENGTGTDCLPGNFTGDAYPTHFEFDCPDWSGNDTLDVAATGAGAYVLVLELPDRVENATVLAETRGPYYGSGAIRERPGAEPTSLLPYRGKAVLQPTETLAPYDGQRRVYRQIIEEEWTEKLDIDDDEVAVVLDGYQPVTSGGGATGELTIHALENFGATFDLPRGEYEVELRAYLTRTYGEDFYINEFADDFVVERPPVRVSTLTLETGSCIGTAEAEAALLDANQRKRAAEAQAVTAQQQARASGAVGVAEVAARVSAAPDADTTTTLGSVVNIGSATTDIRTRLETGRSLDRQTTGRFAEAATIQGQYDALSEAAGECGDQTIVDLYDAYGEGGERAERDERSEQDEDLDADVSREEAIEAVADALRERGFEAPERGGLTLEDYLTTDVHRGSRSGGTGTRHVTLRVGPGGNLLPSHGAVGDAPAGSLQGATHWVDLSLHEIEGGDHDVTLQYIDVETGLIERQRYAGWNTDDQDLSAVTGEAFDAFEVELGQPTDGRVPGAGGGGESSDGGGGGDGGSR
jgi:hypothetical protein